MCAQLILRGSCCCCSRRQRQPSGRNPMLHSSWHRRNERRSWMPGFQYSGFEPASRLDFAGAAVRQQPDAAAELAEAAQQAVMRVAGAFGGSAASDFLVAAAGASLMPHRCCRCCTLPCVNGGTSIWKHGRHQDAACGQQHHHLSPCQLVPRWWVHVTDRRALLLRVLHRPASVRQREGCRVHSAGQPGAVATGEAASHETSLCRCIGRLYMYM